MEVAAHTTGSHYFPDLIEGFVDRGNLSKMYIVA